MQKFKLIIGLGNPSTGSGRVPDKYENTYHNVGHLFVDFLGKGTKSDVFMNQSGKFVKEALKKHKIKPENLLVVHDDSDIELGCYKLSFGRNSAGHRGVQNIIDQLKTKNFWRLRIGIRPHSALRATPSKPRPTADELVLKHITPANGKKLERAFKEAAKVATLL